MAPAWFLLWCEEDTSLSLVEEESVIYGDDVKEGETVKFFYNGEECVGVVRGLGDDHDKLKKLQDKLNSLNKSRPPSFHEGERRAKMKSKENIKSIVNRLKSKSKEPPVSAPSLKKSMEKASPKSQQQSENLSPKQKHTECDSNTDQDDVLDSHSDVELTPEEELLMKKLAKKRSLAESKKDKQLMKKKRHEDHSVADNEQLDKVPSVDDKSSGNETEEEKEDAEGENQEARDGDSSDDSGPTGPVRVGPKQKKKEAEAVPFEGIMYLFQEFDGTDEEREDTFVELLGPKSAKTGIFCKRESLKRAKVFSKAAGAYARKLMEGVFTQAALLQCTVSGDLYKAGGASKMKRIPKLDQNGVMAIIDAASARQARRKWSPVQDPQSIKGAMRQKLVEIRSAHKKHLERKAARDANAA